MSEQELKRRLAIDYDAYSGKLAYAEGISLAQARK